MYSSNNLYSEDDDFAVPETQESPATFSRNIIKRLGIRRTSLGTDAANPNSNTNSSLNDPHGLLEVKCPASAESTSLKELCGKPNFFEVLWWEVSSKEESRLILPDTGSASCYL